MSKVKDYAKDLCVRVAERAGWLTFVDDKILADYFQHSAVLRDQVRGSFGLALKRTLDIVLSLFLVILLAPLMLTIALLIKLTSRGPVLFAQRRLGLNKTHFLIYKFRTIVAGADGPRVTSLARFLRRSSIDELPQLFNVVKGDMSLVGPRPLPVGDYAGFDESWQRRFSVRPGTTSLWQVTRRTISVKEHTELDLRYVARRSIGMDLLILFKTVPAVIRALNFAFRVSP